MAKCVYESLVLHELESSYIKVECLLNSNDFIGSFDKEFDCDNSRSDQSR